MVTNPPFTLAKDFAEKGRKLAKVTTLLVRQSFLSTAKRVAWLKKNIPYSVHMFHRRPKFELSEYQIEVKRYNDPKFDPKDWGTYNAEYCFVTWLHESFKNDQDASLIWIGGDDDV